MAGTAYAANLNGFNSGGIFRNHRVVSDRSLEIGKMYDAANPNNEKRYYFLIDETGKIAWKSTNNSLIPTDKLLSDLSQFAKK